MSTIHAPTSTGTEKAESPRLLPPAEGVRLGLITAIIAVLAVVAAGLTTSIFTAGQWADPGALTRGGLPVATVIRNSAAAVALGSFLLSAAVFSPTTATRPRGHHLTYDAPEWTRAMTIGRVAAIVWPVAEVAVLVLTYSSVAAVGLTDPTMGAGLWQFITEIELGQTMIWSVILASLVPIVAAASQSLAGAAWALGLTAVAMVPQALVGHAAGAAEHNLAVSSMLLHIVAISAWAGGLLVLVVCSPRTGDRAVTYASRYSAIAGWALIMTVFSGFANAWIRFNSLTEFVTTGYGRLLTVKLLLTAVLGIAGLMHRRRTMKQMTSGSSGPFWKLAAGEVLIMGGVMGVAVALGSSAPPVPQEPITDASPFYLLSGYPLPPEPELARYLTEWRLEPILAFLSVTAIVQYLRWVRRLRERRDSWPIGRTISWVIGIVIFAWVTMGGPAVYGSVMFSSHMFMHMVLAMLIPIFVVLGAPVTLMARAVPARKDGSRGGREILLAVAHSKYGAFWAHPVIAALNFAGSLILFYFTDLFFLALTTHVGHMLMIIHFLLAGYMFANVLIGVDPGPQRPAYPLRLLLLFGTMAFHAFFGIAVISSTEVLANDFFGWLGLPWGVNALADQEVGGAITWSIGEVPTLALAVAVAVAWAKSEERVAKRLDRKAERDDDADLRAYNEMLANRAKSSARRP